MSDAVARTRWPRRLGRSRNVVTGALIVTLVVLGALFAGAVSTHNPRRLDPANRLKPPSAQNYLGTDEFGRDVWSLVVHGSQVSLLVGATTMALTSLGGIVVGLVAGYYRRLDLVLMRVMDGLMAFPAILLAIALMAARGSGVGNVTFALSVVSTPRTAMLIRSTVLSIRELDYVQAARARSGAGTSSSRSATSCRTAWGRSWCRRASSSPTRFWPRRSWASSASACPPTCPRGATSSPAARTSSARLSG